MIVRSAIDGPFSLAMLNYQKVAKLLGFYMRIHRETGEPTEKWDNPTEWVLYLGLIFTRHGSSK